MRISFDHFPLLRVFRGLLAVSMAFGISVALPAQWQTAKLIPADAVVTEQLGASVSVSGDTALVGAPGKAGQRGSVYVFVRDAFGNWTEQTELTASDAAGGDQFGVSVSLSGDTALVGAKLEDDAGENSGAAYVFVRDVLGTWTQQAKLIAYDANFGEQYGLAVSLSGDTALIGAGHHTFPAIKGAGYVYVRDGAGNWALQTKLTASDGEIQDAFGSAVSLDGDTALIGAWNEGLNGAAYVYVRDGGGNWSEQSKLTQSDAIQQDRFGRSVSLSGYTALIGTTNGQVAGTRTGSAYVFERDGGGNWSEQTRLTAADAELNDTFGRSVALNGDRAVVAAWGDDNPGGRLGSVYLFHRKVGGSWTQQTELITEDPSASTLFGASVSLCDDRLLIGAASNGSIGAAYEFCLGELTASDATTGAALAGAVSMHNGTVLLGSRSIDVGTGAGYVFVEDGRGIWTQQAKLTASDGVSLDFLGGSVSVHGDTALVGTHSFGDAEAVYVFVRDGMGNWTEQAKLTAADGAQGDTFGDTVSLYGDTALVGARFDDDSGDNSGSVYVFVRDGGGNWTEQAKLNAFDGVADNAFGSSVSLSGDTALIGAIFASPGGVANAGSAYVFVRDGGGNWTEQTKFTVADNTPNLLFGSSVSLDGDTALVGASGDMLAGFFTGSAYVFVRDGGGNWTEQAKLTASDAAEQANFGNSVSLSGNAALVGTRGWGSDSAYWFQRDASGTWTQKAQLRGGFGASTGFGESVSLDGKTALVGDARRGALGVASAGAAQVFCSNPGTLLTFGSGCAGSAGIPTLTGAPGEVPSLGESYGLELSGLPFGPSNAPIGIMGLSKTAWSGILLPLDASVAGLTGCTLYVSIRSTFPLYNFGGGAFWRIDIPNLPDLIGATIYMQGSVTDFGANAASMTLSNAGEATIVGR